VSTVKKRSVSLSGHRTSYSVEDEFLEILKTMAERQSIPLARLISQIDAERSRDTNLSSALRLAALAHLKSGNKD
jgi:predicted DNA-binding ribbon-helix-helix protein